MFISFSSLSRSFRAAARKYALAAGLMLGAAGCTFTDQSVEKLEPQDKHKGKERKERIAKDTLGFNEIAYAARNAYSRQLDSLASDLNGRLTDKSRINKIMVIDPIAVDAGLALGLSTEQAIAQILEGHLPAGDSGSVKAATSYMTHPYRSAHDNILTSYPAATHNRKIAHPVTAVIVPYSEVAIEGRIACITRDEEIEFFNRHEGWHTIDYIYNIKKFGTPELSGDARYSEGHLAEVMADVGALGDMVRAGHRTGLIMDIANFRQSDMEDLSHLSTLALHKLSQKIKKTGLEKFRQMDDSTALKTYLQCVKEGGLDLPNYTAFRDYLYGDDAKRDKMRATYKSNAKVSAFIKFLDEEEIARDAVRLPSATQDSLYYVTKEALALWDALAALQNKASEDGAEINRLTFSRAYGALQDSLHNAIRKDPKAETKYEAQMVRLKATYIKNLRALPK